MFLGVYVGRQKDRVGKEVKILEKEDDIVLYITESLEPNTVPGS